MTLTVVCTLDIHLPNVPKERYSWPHLVRSLTPGRMAPGTYPINDDASKRICELAFDWLDHALDLDPWTR